jgi:hypothetical protein
MHIELFQYFQLASLLLAIWCYRGLAGYSLQLFVPILAITNLLETVGVNYMQSDQVPNDIFYNLYMVQTTPLYLYLYGKMLHLRKNEGTIFRGIFSLVVFFLLFNFFYWQGMNDFNTYSLILTEVTHIVFSSLTLIRLSASDRSQGALAREPYFWINSGNLLFGLVTLVLLGLQDYIRKHQIQIEHKALYIAILPTANILLYSMFGLAFLLCQTRTQSSR